MDTGKACGGSCRKNGARVRENERGYIAAWVWANIRKTVNSVATHLGIVDPVVPISGARERLGAAHSPGLRSGVRCASFTTIELMCQLMYVSSRDFCVSKITICPGMQRVRCARRTRATARLKSASTVLLYNFYSTPSWRWCECDESKNSLTLFKMVREGFTCGRLVMIHSSRVRTELFPVAVAVATPPGLRVIPLRKLPSSSKNNCSSTSATPMPSSPPATHSFRPKLRCELANETARGRISCTKMCCPRFPKGRCIRSTRDVPSLPPGSVSARVSLSSERGSTTGEVLSVSPGVAFDVDAYTTMNAVSISPSLFGAHVLGTLAGSSRGRSTSVQSSTRPRTFSTGVGSMLHAPPSCSPSTPEVCCVPRTAVTSLTTKASTSSREHANNSVRCLQNSCGVRPYNVVGQ